MHTTFQVFITTMVSMLATATMGRPVDAPCDLSFTNTLSPDPAIQAQIDRVTTLIGPTAKTGTEEQFKVGVESLKQMAGYDQLIPQLILRSVNAQGFEQGMVPIVILRELQPSTNQIRNAVLPYLGTRDSKLRQELWNCLIRLDEPVPGKEPDFSYYESVLENRNADAGLPLIEYMYYRSPQQALRTMMRVHSPKDQTQSKAITESLRIITAVNTELRQQLLSREDAAFQIIEELTRMAEYDHWWVQLYVVETIRQSPLFRDQKLVARLTQSKHPLVREALESLRNER